MYKHERIVEGFSEQQVFWREWLPVLLLMGVTTILCLYKIGSESLWIDELISVERSGDFDFQDLFRVGRPLYFGLLAIWMNFGSSEAWLRGLSVIFGVGSIPLIYLLGCQVSGREVGLIAALLYALSPLSIDHAQEIRMYPLSVFLGVGGSLAMAHTLEKLTFRNILSWFFLRILAIFTTSLNLILLLPDAVLFLFKFRSRLGRLPKKLKRYIWLMLIPSIAILPFILKEMFRIYLFLGTLPKSEPSPELFQFARGMAKFTIGVLYPPFDTLTNLYQPFFFNIYALIIVGLVCIALFYREFRAERLFWVATWGFLSLIVIFSFSQVLGGELWNRERYLLFASPYILILVAAGFLRLLKWKRLPAFAVMAIYVVAIGGGLFRYYSVQDRPDLRGAVQTINTYDTPKDTIVVLPETRKLALEYYYTGTASSKIIEPFQGDRKVSSSQVRQALCQLPVSDRYWFLLDMGTSEPALQSLSLFQEAIEHQFDLQDRYSFSGGVKLYLVTTSNESKSGMTQQNSACVEGSEL